MTPSQDTKVCVKCGVEHPVTRFDNRILDSGRKTRRNVCRDCRQTQVRSARTARKGNLRRQYGITIEQHDAMLTAQGGRCAICGTPSEQSAYGALAVDHNHTTGQVRGLLCHQCNMALGLFKDNPELLKQATDYLEQHS